MEDIVFCKRIGKMRQGKTRGILLKLANTKLKQRVYNSKKRLKGTGVVMKEDLTENKMKLMEAAIEKTSLRDVWSSMGNVFAMKNNVRHLIDSKAALDNLYYCVLLVLLLRKCIYVYICMYVCICVCICVCMYICIYIYMYIYVYMIHLQTCIPTMNSLYVGSTLGDYTFICTL
nr:unnamed protein product [Callosobruchus analis]